MKLTLFSSIFMICSSVLVYAQQNQDTHSYNKKLRSLRREAKEYFWDLEKLERLLNLEAVYQKQVDSIIAAQNQIQEQLLSLASQKNTISRLEKQILAFREQIDQKDERNAASIREINSLSHHLDSIQNLNTQLDSKIIQLTDQIQLLDATLTQYSSSQKNIPLANGRDPSGNQRIQSIDQLSVDKEILRLKEELLRTKIIAKNHSDVMQRYVEKLEQLLEDNGISFLETRNTYQQKIDSFQNHVDFLNMLLVSKDAMQKKNALLAEQKINLIESEKQAAENARRLTELRYQRNGIIFGLTCAALLLVIGLFYRYTNIISKKNTEISSKNQKLLAKNKEIQEKNAHIEMVNEHLEHSYAKIQDSIRYAKTIQNAILPNPQTLADFVQDYFILYQPKDIVSGDFYWFSQQHTYLYLAIVDCTGHGVPGAFMSMIGNTLLNKIIHENPGYSPSEMLKRLHQEIQINLNQEESLNNDGMDMALCVFERLPENKTKITFSGAKRPLYFIKRQNNELKEIRGNRISIGGNNKKRSSFEDTYITLDANTVVYLTTDGFADQNNAARKKIGTQALKRLLAEHSHLELTEQHKVLSNYLKEHSRDTAQRDDITILGLKV